MSVEQATTPVEARSMGTALRRVDGPEKVTGRAPSAVEHREAPFDAEPLSLWLVQSTVARGRVTRVDPAPALAHTGVVAVLDHTSAPRLHRGDDEPDRELWVLQDDRIDFRGQVVAVVLAETVEAAREGAALVRVS